MRYLIKKKLNGTYFKETHPLGHDTKIYRVKKISATVKTYLNNENNLKDLLIGTPDVLDKIKNKFTRTKDKDSVKALLNWDDFIDTSPQSTYRFYNAYDLALNLDHQTCVYCNRLYTHTVVKKNELITRPAFDHWFPKGKHPLLALSFYNLVPSCTVCNSSVKGDTPFNLWDYFHPYLRHSQRDKQMNFQFTYNLKDHVTAKCKLKGKNKFTNQSLAVLKLKEQYEMHNGEVRDLIHLKKANSASYLQSLQSLVKTKITNADLYRVVFGVYMEDDMLHLRPLSKLKKDILKELKII